MQAINELRKAQPQAPYIGTRHRPTTTSAILLPSRCRAACHRTLHERWCGIVQPASYAGQA